MSQLAQLAKLYEKEEFDKVIHLAKKIQDQVPQAKEVIAVALIKQEKYQQALDITLDPFHQAYCYYKLFDYEKCLQLIQEHPSDKNNFLKAQVLYRQGKYSESLEVYSTLKHEDLHINISAMKQVDSSEYEVAYNTACLYLDKDLTKSSQYLQVATKNSDSIQDTVLFKAQAAYIQQRLNKKCDYGESRESSEVDVKLIAQFNASLNASTLEAFKLSKSLASIRSQLLPFQVKTLDWNRVLLLHQMGNMNAAKQALHEFHQQYPGQGFVLQNLFTPFPIDKVEAEYKSTKNVDVGCLYLSLLCQQNMFEEAIQLASDLIQVAPSHRLGLLSVLCFLYKKTNQPEKALKRLESYKDDSTLKSMADFKLDLGRYQEAIQDYEKLSCNDATSGLLMAYSMTDPYKAKSLLSSISIPRIETIDHLIRLKTITKQVKKRKRKPNPLPKNYDPNRQPDPNRWLPKRK